MTSLSQIIKNGQTLQAPAGPLAINQNDLVILGGSPAQLYSAAVADYAAVAAAGSAVVASTTYSSYGAAQSTPRNLLVVNPSDGALFIADTYLTGLAGTQVWKYSAVGALIGSVILDSNATGITSTQIVQQSNGNLVVFWAYANAGLYFAIIDQNLNVIVPKTLIATVGSNPGPSPFMLPLSGGGFAISYTVAGAPGGLYLVIYNNAGALVSGPTSIPGVPAQGASNGIATRLAQLSNGNIAIASIDGGTKVLSYAIYTAAGAAVVGYTALTGATASQGIGYPEISVLPGYFCVSVGNGTPTTVSAFVMNNAGQLQGAAFTVTNGNSQGRLINDGTNFWLFYFNGTSMFSVKMPVTGTNFISTALTSLTGMGDVFYERGLFAVCNGTTAYVYTVIAAGQLVLAGSAALASSVQVKAGIGDFCVIGMAGGKFNITKYLNASIFGLASTAVAAGNANTLVSCNPGPGSYPSNPLSGSPSKTFDHSAAPVVGNKGTLFSNGTVLKGF